MAGTEDLYDAPRLVVTTPGHLNGTVLVLSGDSVTIGRDENCELQLDYPAVSRSHAVVNRSGSKAVILDLGSTNGTTVNGIPAVGSPAPLLDGDVVSFGDLQARYDARGGESDRTEQVRAVPATSGPPRPEYRIDRQTAEVLSNVAGDQYNAYVQQIREERESFLREIAATKTKARRLIWVGFGLFILGFATHGWTLMDFIVRAEQSVSATGGSLDAKPSFLSTQVAGMPILFLGIAAFYSGIICMVVGFVLHIVAASKRRRLPESTPTPWQWKANER